MDKVSNVLSLVERFNAFITDVNVSTLDAVSGRFGRFCIDSYEVKSHLIAFHGNKYNLFYHLAEENEVDGLLNGDIAFFTAWWDSAYGNNILSELHLGKGSSKIESRLPCLDFDSNSLVLVASRAYKKYVSLHFNQIMTGVCSMDESDRYEECVITDYIKTASAVTNMLFKDFFNDSPDVDYGVEPFRVEYVSHCRDVLNFRSQVNAEIKLQNLLCNFQWGLGLETEKCVEAYLVAMASAIRLIYKLISKITGAVLRTFSQFINHDDISSTVREREFISFLEVDFKSLVGEYSSLNEDLIAKTVNLSAATKRAGIIFESLAIAFGWVSQISNEIVGLSLFGQLDSSEVTKDEALLIIRLIHEKRASFFGVEVNDDNVQESIDVFSDSVENEAH